MIAVWLSSGIKTTWLCLSTDTGLGGKNTMLYMFCIWQKLNTFCSYTNINVDFWFQKGHEQSPWEKGCICLTHWLDWIRRNMLTVRGVVVVNAWMDMKFFMGICVTTDIKKKIFLTVFTSSLTLCMSAGENKTEGLSSSVQDRVSVSTLLDLVGLGQKTESRAALEHVFWTDFSGKGLVHYLHANQRSKILTGRIFVYRLKHLARIQNLPYRIKTCVHLYIEQISRQCRLRLMVWKLNSQHASSYP